MRIKCKNSVPSFGTILLMRSQELQSEIQLNKRGLVSAESANWKFQLVCMWLFYLVSSNTVSICMHVMDI